MCKPIDCSSCTGKTWIGCGLHIPYAMNLVPKDLWCSCISESGVESEYPPKFGDGVASEENELSVKIHPRESLA